MPAALHLWLLSVDALHVLEPALAEPTTCDGGARRPVVCTFRIREVDEPVLAEVGVDGDIEQSALPACGDCRNTRQRLRQPSSAIDDAKASRTFGDEDAAVGKKRERPRVNETACYRLGGDVSVDGRGGRRALRRPRLLRRLRLAASRLETISGMEARARR